jgi:ABC-type transport system involved in multi-copper enzyme maturation permease subunit
MGADNLFIWAALVQMILAFGPIVALVLTGNGISNLGPATSAGYTLTLPISRFRLIWTRMVAGSLAAILMIALELAFAWALLLSQGRGLPVAPFALSAAFYAPTLVACTAVMGALLIIHQGAAIVGSLAMLVLSAELNRRTVTAMLARGEMPWVSLAALLAATALGFMGCVRASRVKDF